MKKTILIAATVILGLGVITVLIFKLVSRDGKKDGGLFDHRYSVSANVREIIDENHMRVSALDDFPDIDFNNQFKDMKIILECPDDATEMINPGDDIVFSYFPGMAYVDGDSVYVVTSNISLQRRNIP